MKYTVFSDNNSYAVYDNELKAMTVWSTLLDIMLRMVIKNGDSMFYYTPGKPIEQILIETDDLMEVYEQFPDELI